MTSNGHAAVTRRESAPHLQFSGTRRSKKASLTRQVSRPTGGRTGEDDSETVQRKALQTGWQT